MRVEVKSKVIPANFLKIEGRGPSLGQKLDEEEQAVEVVGDQSPNFEAPFRSKRGGSKGDFKRGVMEWSWCVRVIKWKEAKGVNSIEYFLLAEIKVLFGTQRK